MIRHDRARRRDTQLQPRHLHCRVSSSNLGIRIFILRTRRNRKITKGHNNYSVTYGLSCVLLMVNSSVTNLVLPLKQGFSCITHDVYKVRPVTFSLSPACSRAGGSVDVQIRICLAQAAVCIAVWSPAHHRPSGCLASESGTRTVGGRAAALQRSASVCILGTGRDGGGVPLI